MKTRFYLAWHKPGKAWRQAFKDSSCTSLVQEYTKRANKFSPCEINGVAWPRFDRSDLGSRAEVWICDLAPQAKMLGSAEIAKKLAQLQNAGTDSLNIFIGGADGWSQTQFKSLHPSFRWSFGPITLPHELATVVACEQIYRAYTILRGLPYHHA